MSSKASTSDDDLREEYGFTAEELRAEVRGRFAARYAEGVNLVPIDPKWPTYSPMRSP